MGNPITGSILSVNLSRGGIPKWPVAQAYLTSTGLEGDSCAHPRIHGGPQKAVLLITSESIDELRALGYALYPGALGENFTTTGLDRKQLRVGMRLRAGQATIEISRMRAPCATLDALNEPHLPPIQEAIFDAQVKAGDPCSPRWGLAGFYARVTEEGVVRAGDRISLVDILV